MDHADAREWLKQKLLHEPLKEEQFNIVKQIARFPSGEDMRVLESLIQSKSLNAPSYKAVIERYMIHSILNKQAESLLRDYFRDSNVELKSKRVTLKSFLKYLKLNLPADKNTYIERCKAALTFLNELKDSMEKEDPLLADTIECIRAVNLVVKKQ